MSAEVVAKVLKNTHTTHTVTQGAILHDFQRHSVHGELYPAAIPRSGATVTGALIQGITAAELLYLDEFEGEEYERRTVKVDVGGASTACDMYVWVAGDDRLYGEWNLDDNRISAFLKTF